jgi:transmembrane sensor
VARRQDASWSTGDERALCAWAEASARHREALALAERAWELGGRAARASDLASARAAGRPTSRARPRFAPALGVLAAALVLSAGTWWSLRPAAPIEQAYATVKGQASRVALADGSVVELDTATSLRVRLSPGLRQVILERGEAFFTVVHDASRPFEVLAGGGRVRDLGTRFAVRAEQGAVTVTVAEGLVDVTAGAGPAAEVRPGQRVAFAPDGAAGAVEAVDPAEAGAWREGLLVFHDRPIAWVLAELARYHDVAFEPPPGALAARRVSGRFEIADVRGVLSALEAVAPVRARWLDPRRVRLEARPARPSPGPRR